MKDKLAERRENCLYRGNHTRAPKGYLAWHNWAEEKAKTHDCTQCPGCNLWVIWKPKKA